jgi:hypothetical protein
VKVGKFCLSLPSFRFGIIDKNDSVGRIRGIVAIGCFKGEGLRLFPLSGNAWVEREGKWHSNR